MDREVLKFYRDKNRKILKLLLNIYLIIIVYVHVCICIHSCYLTSTMAYMLSHRPVIGRPSIGLRATTAFH